MADPADPQRLDDLEVRLTFIDDTVNALSAADADLSLRLRQLEQALRDVRDELAAVRNALGHDASSEPPPPHY